MRRTKRQKAKIAKVVAIASAVILLLTFLFKEVVKENLKELHEALVRAESQFRTENGQSVISLQILDAQEQIENFKLQGDAGKKGANRDFSALIAQDTARAQEASAHLNSDFDSVSRLIDALPSGAKDLRQLRDETRASVDKANKQVNEMLKPKPAHDRGRFVEVKIAMVMALLQELPVVILGDAAQTAAHRVQAASEYLIGVCSRAIYFLGFLALSLGLYAAVTGIKSDGPE